MKYWHIFGNVTCNEVLKNRLNFTSLKVEVFPFFNTSLKVKVLKLLLKYNNALLLLRYCTTLQTDGCLDEQTNERLDEWQYADTRLDKETVVA